MVQYAMDEILGGAQGFTWGSPGAKINPLNTNIINFEHVNDVVPIGGLLVFNHLTGTEVLLNNSVPNSAFQDLIGLQFAQHDM